MRALTCDACVIIVKMSVAAGWTKKQTLDFIVEHGFKPTGVSLSRLEKAFNNEG